MPRKPVYLYLIAILLVLAAFVVPALAPARARYNSTDCIMSLKQMGVYFTAYVSKYHEYPAIGTGPNSWFSQIWSPEFASDGNLFRCASRGRAGTGTDYWTVVRPGTWVSGKTSFTFTSGKDVTAGPADLPIVCDRLDLPSEHHEGRFFVLCLSGEVKRLEGNDPFVKSPPSYLGPSGWVAPAGTK